jgi:hypothetical protein
MYSASDAGAAFVFRDGTIANVGWADIYRSSVLHQLASGTDELASLPKDVLPSWLECVEVLRQPLSCQACHPRLLEFLLV